MCHHRFMKIFYNPAQTVPYNPSNSPSAGKPALVVDLFKNYKEVEIVSNFRPLTVDEICLAHDRDHVQAVLDCKKNNGFDNKLESIAKSLHWTNSSMYHAAKYAFENKTVTMSPTSGFHHAEYDQCMGFCTFNGLMIASIMLHNNDGAKKVGIIDFDAHYGNGTDNIIDRLKIDYVKHMSFGDSADYFKENNWFDVWLNHLEKSILQGFLGCDILLYQAGADPHIHDPFGGYLTTEQMRRRDEIVFKTVKHMNIPMAWNLAGGYQRPIEKVLALHENTLKECLKYSW